MKIAYQFGDLMEQYQAALVLDLQEAVRIPSVRGPGLPGKPFGEGPYAALQHALALGKSWGMHVHDEQGYAGHVEIGTGSEIVGVLVHLDVVPEGTGWSVPPYGGIIQGNRILGRGVSDNKGPAIAALYALKAFKDAGIVPKRRIRVILGCSEETGMEDMARYFEHQPIPDVAFVPDAGYPAINREKGIMGIACTAIRSSGIPYIVSIRGGDAINKVPDWCEARVDSNALDPETRTTLINRLKLAQADGTRTEQTSDGLLLIRTTGKATHGAVPELGVNAIARMALILDGIDEISAAGRIATFLASWIGMDYRGQRLGIACSDLESGPLSLNIGTIESFGETCTTQLDLRHPVTADSTRIEELLINAGKQSSVSITIKSRLASLHVPADQPLIKKLRKAYRMYFGSDPEPVSCSGGTYARTLKGHGVAFGGTGGNGHQSDEYVDIDDLMLHTKICAQAIYELAMEI